MAITLPTTKIPAVTQDPKRLIIYSKPKCGKSSACAALPNALCIDLEDGGYDYIEAVKITANSVQDLKDIAKEIKKAGNPYKFIVLDSLSRLEDMVKPLALQLYQATESGKNFTGTDVTDAAHGAGYGYVRKALEMVVDMFAKLTPNIVLICHTKDASINNSEATVKQISLSGKTGAILASKSDAIAWMTRDEDSNTILDFDAMGSNAEVGARPAHLRNKQIVLGEMQSDGTIEYHWERIFPSLSK